MQFGDHTHLQKYAEIDGSIAYLKYNTVKQIVGLKNYMSMLIDQDRPAAQKNNLLYFISGCNQLSNLTAHGVRRTLVEEVLEIHRSQTTLGKPISKITSPHLLHL